MTKIYVSYYNIKTVLSFLQKRNRSSLCVLSCIIFSYWINYYSLLNNPCEVSRKSIINWSYSCDSTIGGRCTYWRIKIITWEIVKLEYFCDKTIFPHFCFNSHSTPPWNVQLWLRARSPKKKNLVIEWSAFTFTSGLIFWASPPTIVSI